MESKSYSISALKRADEIDSKIIEILQSRSSFRVEAGAGAGKTHSLHKVVEWLDQNRALDYMRNGQQVACITYTNAAVGVLSSRISYESSIVPCTIHSFVWENIRTFTSPLLRAVSELNLYPDDCTIESVKKVTYDLGIRHLDDDGTLHLYHSDVIALMAWFLNQNKFRRILTDKYPVILIDEYQDSFKIIIDKFLEYFIDTGKGPQFGFFGDSWQTIYASQGACGLIQSPKLVVVKKDVNFRSQQIIVDVLNRIRPNLPQQSALEDNDGEVIVITTNDYKGCRVNSRYYKGELPDDDLYSYISNVQKFLETKGWNDDNKVMMITHKMLAKQQNYQNFHMALGEHFGNQDDEHFCFFRDRIEPVYKALSQNDARGLYDALGTVRQPITSKFEKRQWTILRENLEVARSKTIYDVLALAIDCGLIPIPPSLYSLFISYNKGGTVLYHKTTLDNFYKIEYGEVVRSIDFFKPDAVFSTDHGVKGEEYDNVLLVVGRGWTNYKFEDILYKSEDSLAGKDLEAYVRNRNLFYVCCSRPRKRLGLFITVPISNDFLNYLERVFGKENVYSYNSLFHCD